MPLFETRKKTKDSDLALAKKTKKSSAGIRRSNPMEEVEAAVLEALGRLSSKYAYILADNKILFEEVIDEACRCGECSLDTETTGLSIVTDNIVGFSIYIPSTDKSYYIPLNHCSTYTKLKCDNQMEYDFCASQLNKLVEKGVKIIYHNSKFDIKFFYKNLNIKLPVFWDTQIAANLIDENEDHSLKVLFHKYCGDKDNDEIFRYSDLFGEINFGEVPMRVGYIYACRDPEMTYLLYQYQKKLFESDSSLSKVYKLFSTLEMPIVDAIIDMELRGVMIDRDYAEQLKGTYRTYLKEAQDNFYNELSKYQDRISKYQILNRGKLSSPFNYASPQQLSILLYDILNLSSPDNSKPRGTGEDILIKLGIPLSNLILECRKYEKLLGTYIEAIPELADSSNAIHTKFNQMGTVTGRFSSSNPNLQNIPSHDKYIRKMFTARPGFYLVGADYSQQEPRILAHLSKDESLIDAYNNKRDIYAQVASLIYRLPYEQCLEFNPDGSTNEVQSARRAKVKAIVLGIMYGRGSASVAEDLKITKAEATEILNRFFQAFPRVEQFVSSTQNKARKDGFVETIWGRKRRLPDMLLEPFEISAPNGYIKDFNPLSFGSASVGQLTDDVRKKWVARLSRIYSWKERAKIIEEARQDGLIIKENDLRISDAERQCVNSVIQGSAADMTKRAIMKIHQDSVMRELDFHMLLLVHDEIIGECPQQNALKAAKRLTELMVAASDEKLSIPMKCDYSISKCWKGEPIILEE